MNAKDGLALAPFTTKFLKPTKLSTNNGIIEVTQDLSFLVIVQGGKILFRVSPNGQQITISNNQKVVKSYALSSLPQKYHKLYNYAKTVCNTLKSKTPVVKIQNKYGNFMVMANFPSQTFEAVFTNGYRLSHLVSSKEMTIKNFQNQQFNIRLDQDTSKLSVDITIAIKLGLKYLSDCLSQQQ